MIVFLLIIKSLLVKNTLKMNNQKFSTLLFILINFVLLDCNSQNMITDDLNYYKIDLKSQQTSLSTLMRKKYKKEFYSNEQLTVYKNQNNEFLELIFFYKNGAFEKHLFKNNEHFTVKNAVYIDESINELSDFENEELKKKYFIKKNDLKKINENECFKITMEEPYGTVNLEMYVSRDIPNLPNHFPLPSNVFNGEPLEIRILLFSETIEFGITEFLKNVNIGSHLGISFKNPKEISESEYEKIKR